MTRGSQSPGSLLRDFRLAGIYLHIPYCAQRCSYCDFYFVTTRTVHTPFVEAIVQELRLYAAEYSEREGVDTIYFGGGTPSQLLIEEVERILRAVHESFDTSEVREVTFEINPEDADVQYLRGLKTLGIDRLSIGIQSFFDQDLQFMRRVHDKEQARESISAAVDAGFEKYSIDLIFGVPGQPEEYWAANLEIANEMNVPHISTYSLTVEERTPLWKQVQLGRIEPVDGDVHTERFRFAIDRSIHNHRYWTHHNYIGCGPSAHSFWWRGLPARRWSNVRNLNRYQAFLAGHTRPIEVQEELSLDVLAREYVMLRLRTSDGLDLDVLENRYGVDLLLDRIDELAFLEESNFIEPIRNQIVRLTELGKTVCDSVTERLMPKEN